MADIRPIDVIQRKWATVTPSRTPDYQFGVENPRTDWQRAALAADAAWKAGVQTAITQNLFTRGINRAGTAAWQRGATTKGVQRWGPGVQLAEATYGAAFAPFVEAIRRVTLPPRFARRDPRNLLRVAAIVNAMIETASRQTA